MDGEFTGFSDLIRNILTVLLLGDYGNLANRFIPCFERWVLILWEIMDKSSRLVTEAKTN